jgi:DUF971 family protein
MNAPTANHGASLQVDQQDQGLTVTWLDGHQRFYHYVWLRSCCYCSQCGSTYLGTSTLQPCDVGLEIIPKNVIGTDDAIDIVWADDLHESRYSASWLRENAYHKADRVRRKHQPVTWNSDISASPPTVEFSQARSSNEQLLDFLRKLRDYGFVIVRNGPYEVGSVETVAALISEIADSAYGKIFDLNPSKTALTFGNTMNFVPPHTDEAYLYSPPGVNILHCVHQAENGGESLLVDGFYLSNQMREHHPDHFETLTTIPQPYHRIVPDDGVYQRMCGQVIKVDNEGDVVGFRFHTRSAAPLDVPEGNVLQVHAANVELSRMMLQEESQACFKLESGDAVFFDNHRVMHARKAFDDPHRHMQIANVSRERFHLKLRVTAAELGHKDEANQILNAGVAG